MSEQNIAISRILAACWKDDALKARFIADPGTVLAEHGIDVPDRIELRVVENTDNCVHITLPKRPANHDDLSDEELDLAAGGGAYTGYVNVYDDDGDSTGW